MVGVRVRVEKRYFYGPVPGQVVAAMWRLTSSWGTVGPWHVAVAEDE